MARKQYVDLSNSIEAWRQKCNITADYIGDLDGLNLPTPHDQTIVKAINHLDDKYLDENQIKKLFSVIHSGPTTLSSLIYDPNTATFYYNTVDLQSSHIPNLDASKITTGVFDGARIPGIDASKVTSGVFSIERIPNLPASKIPNLDASKITTGQFNEARIPNLDASKITTGTFSLDRIPLLSLDKIPTLTNDKLPASIDSSKLPAFTADKLPQIPLDKIPVLTADKLPNIPLDKLPLIPLSQIDGDIGGGGGGGDDVVYISQVQTITAQKTFNGGIVMGSTIVADANSTRDIGTSAIRFDNIFANVFDGTATQALYADLAEKYLADDNYPVGTIIAVGGEKEITIANQNNKHSIIGTVSENPGLLLNSSLENGTPVALKGRVPVLIIGDVQKGDRLVLSDVPGRAMADNTRDDYLAIALANGSDLVEAVLR